MSQINLFEAAYKLRQRFISKSFFILKGNTIAVFLLLSLQSPLSARVRDTITEKIQANTLVELTFAAKHTYTDPFNQVTLDVEFTDPQGSKLRIPAFWDGNNKWKVRYASPILGIHRFHSLSSVSDDKGLDGVTGKVQVEAYKGKNLLFRHGVLRVADDKRHFAYADGTPFSGLVIPGGWD